MTTLMAVVALGVGLAASGGAEVKNLMVTQDGSSMERAIAQYLQEAHGITCQEKQVEEGDILLVLPYDVDPMPKFSVALDTQSVNTDKEGKVVERAVRIQIFTGVIAPEEKQAAVLDVVNDTTGRGAFSATYLDTDGEVVLDWSLNVMEQGLHPEYVWDAVARQVSLWERLWPKVQEALK